MSQSFAPVYEDTFEVLDPDQYTCSQDTLFVRLRAGDWGINGAIDARLILLGVADMMRREITDLHAGLIECISPAHVYDLRIEIQQNQYLLTRTVPDFLKWSHDQRIELILDAVREFQEHPRDVD